MAINELAAISRSRAQMTSAKLLGPAPLPRLRGDNPSCDEHRPALRNPMAADGRIVDRLGPERRPAGEFASTRSSPLLRRKSSRSSSTVNGRSPSRSRNSATNLSILGCSAQIPCRNDSAERPFAAGQENSVMTSSRSCPSLMPVPSPASSRAPVGVREVVPIADPSRARRCSMYLRR